MNIQKSNEGIGELVTFLKEYALQHAAAIKAENERRKNWRVVIWWVTEVSKAGVATLASAGTVAAAGGPAVAGGLIAVAVQAAWSLVRYIRGH